MNAAVTSRRKSASSAGSDDPLRLDLQLCFALYAAASDLVRLYRPHLEPLGLTYPQYLVMLVLWEEAPRSVGDLGARLGLDSATLTPLLKRLEGRGLVTRTRDPGDERRVLVAPSAAGRAMKAKAARVPGAVSCRIPLPMSELAELRDEVKRLRAALAEAGGTPP